MLDTSESMGLDLQLARSAAVRFLNLLPDARDMTFVDFETEVRVAKFGQQDFPRLVERIRSRKAGGDTAMYDALGVYLDGAEEEEGRTVMVIFTDGGDTRSTIRLNDVLTLVRASDVSIYAIGFLANQPSGARAEQRSRLERIAEEAGGEAFFPRTMKEVDEAFDRIVRQVREQYHLGFVSSNPARDGGWRRVEIRVKRDGLRDVRIRARRGYFAPFVP
jgi:Ca-activated chloride channel family protein